MNFDGYEDHIEDSDPYVTFRELDERLEKGIMIVTSRNCIPQLRDP
jgi:hypothetical protein